MNLITKTHITTTEALYRLGKHSLVPLFYNNNIEQSKALITACYDGGVRVIEFTNRGADAYSIYQELLDWVQNTFDDLLLGIGTIKTGEEAKLFLDLGAHFIVAPLLDLKVGDLCAYYDTLWIPGCGSLTEFFQAYNHGAGVVKAFPVQFLGGSDYIKAVLAPCPELKIMVSGGINASNKAYHNYLNAGAYCVGMGSSLFLTNSQGEFDYDAITLQCQQILENEN